MRAASGLAEDGDERPHGRKPDPNGSEPTIVSAPTQTYGGRSGAALVAGAVAIGANTLALKTADLIPLATAKGGVLRLASPWFAPILRASGLAGAWRTLGAPQPDTPLFQTGFHVVVGLGMAMIYAFALEPVLPGRAWMKGALYALVVWLLNAAIVLPATGEGFAGAAHLTPAGIVWFAAAHTVFFILLAILFESFIGKSSRSHQV